MSDEEVILAEENIRRHIADHIICRFSPNMEPMSDDVRMCLRMVMGMTAGTHTE